MKNIFRCNCPITSALDIIGDKWSLVIIKQMLFENRKTFKDFVESEESIATNILSARLKMLETYDIIEKLKLPNNKKSNFYALTQKGVALTPIIMELVLWSKNNLQEFHSSLNLDKRLNEVEKNKEHFYKEIMDNYEATKFLSDSV